MILSREKKFVFIHIPKTAGTSISKLLKEIVSDAASPFNTHLPARAIQLRAEKIRGTEDIASYQSFSFVRNPFERMHSLYHFIKSRWPDSLQGKDLNQWLFDNEEVYDGRQTVPGESPIPSTRKPQIDWLTSCQYQSFASSGITPKLIPSFIGRYENLREDLEDILYQLGLGDPKRISDHVKFRLEKTQDYHRDKEYRKYYNGQGREWVEKYMEIDLEYFGYRF